VPYDDLVLALRFDQSSAFRKVIVSFVFAVFSRFMKRKLRSLDFCFPERVYGLFQTGNMNEAYFLETLKSLNAKSNEIYFHPALDERRQKPESAAGLEFAALTSQRVVEQLKQLQIRRINYFELEAAR